jgi:hypothetical protein
MSLHDNTHHKLIGIFMPSVSAISNMHLVILLILEHACLSYASQSKPTRDEALNQAYSQYRASGVHNAIIKHFSAPPKQYSISQFMEFILEHHL